ncbi:hypothetical protein HZH68_010105 [Vespula germanica]|uniref:Uncharacterized protein n=1 Tax=Vespula germanica TaxID=30212 RepID=A0A834JXP3_VESGE|nr:hypothetical protein HZH68_010105 [Vespula germanica]
MTVGRERSGEWIGVCGGHSYVCINMIRREKEEEEEVKLEVEVEVEAGRHGIFFLSRVTSFKMWKEEEEQQQREEQEQEKEIK